MPAPLPDLLIRSARADYSVVFPPLTDISQWQPQADLLLVDRFFRDRLAFPAGLPVLWIEATEEAKALEQTLPLFVALNYAWSAAPHVSPPLAEELCRTSPPSWPPCS